VHSPQTCTGLRSRRWGFLCGCKRFLQAIPMVGSARTYKKQPLLVKYRKQKINIRSKIMYLNTSSLRTGLFGPLGGCFDLISRYTRGMIGFETVFHFCSGPLTRLLCIRAGQSMVFLWLYERITIIQDPALGCQRNEYSQMPPKIIPNPSNHTKCQSNTIKYHRKWTEYHKYHSFCPWFVHGFSFRPSPPPDPPPTLPSARTLRRNPPQKKLIIDE